MTVQITDRPASSVRRCSDSDHMHCAGQIVGLEVFTVSRGFHASLRARARGSWVLNEIHPPAMSESKRPKAAVIRKNWNQAQHDDRNPRDLPALGTFGQRHLQMPGAA
jgi:hypothetical protein